MTVPLALMSLAAPVGAIDVLYFHVWKFRLYELPSARAETVTHLLRGALFAAGAYLLASYQLHGGWFWAVGALFVVDFINTLSDVALEPHSRAPLGGIPRAESLLHITGSTFAGAITASYFLVGWHDRLAPTALLPVPGDTPEWLAWYGRALGISSALLTLAELGLLLRALGRRAGSARQ